MPLKPDPKNCPDCEKVLNLCVCDSIKPIDNDIFVLVLRHPQEQDRTLGTAKMLTMQLKNSMLKTGLSWRNLSKILGKEVDNKKWGVLYLGTAKTAEPLPPAVLTIVNKSGGVADDQKNSLRNLEGIILLDGNWSQAKTLWWRNAWMLKCRRLVLQPPKESLYGNLRKEPRKDSVSTIEAAAYTLAALEKDDRLAAKILVPFEALLKKARGKK